MSDVILLTPPAPRIWVCLCGCSTFEILETDEARCANCLTISGGPATGGWIRDAGVDDLTPFRDVRGNYSIEFARRRVATIAASEDAELIVIARSNGSVHTWASAEQPSQLAWVKEKLREARKMIIDHVESYNA